MMRAGPMSRRTALRALAGAAIAPAALARGADPFGVESREPWTFGGAKGETIRTRHYRIFTTETDKNLTGRLPRFLEMALDHYRSALGPLPGPPMRLDTFLMDNRQQWSRLTLQLMGEEGRSLMSVGRGGFATGGRAVLYDIGLFDTLSIAAHEGWHQYTQRTFREPLPVWLEEGIATFMEGHRWAGDSAVFMPWANVERFDHLRGALAKKEGSTLEELVGSRPQDLLGRPGDPILMFYAQGWALMHFLAEGEGGRLREGFRRLISDAAEGRLAATLRQRLGDREMVETMRWRVGDGVIRAYIEEDPGRLEGAFARFQEGIIRPGGRDAVVEGRSPIAG